MPCMSSVENVPCRFGWPHDVFGAVHFGSLYAATFFSAGTRRSSDTLMSSGTGGFSASSSRDTGRDGAAGAWANATSCEDAATSAAMVQIAAPLRSIEISEYRC